MGVGGGQQRSRFDGRRGRGTGDVTPIDNGTVSHWQHQSDARAAIVQQLIGSYADAGGADIDFESIPYSDYFTRLGAALEAGNGPCVMQIPANILAEFQARGQLAPMPDSVMTADEMESTFTPASIALLDIDGAVLRHAHRRADVACCSTTTTSSRRRGSIPTKDFETWDDFRAAAIALTKMDGDNMSQAGLDITSSPYQWYYSAPTLAYEDGLVNDETLRRQLRLRSRLPGVGPADVAGDRGPCRLARVPAEQSKFGSGLAGMTLEGVHVQRRVPADRTRRELQRAHAAAGRRRAVRPGRHHVVGLRRVLGLRQPGRGVELDPVPHVGGLTANLDRRRRRAAVAPVAARRTPR